jgi:hypothetical protein
VREGASREERGHLASARGETIENGRGRWGEKRDEDHQPHVRARSEGPEPALEVGWRPLESPAESLSCVSVDEKIILTHLGMVNRATTSQVLFPMSCLSFAPRRHLFFSVMKDTGLVPLLPLSQLSGSTSSAPPSPRECQED